MASVKLALAVFFLATVVIFPMKKVEACYGGVCYAWDEDYPYCEENRDCKCIPWGAGLFGNCIYNPNSITKMVEEHPNLCQSQADCIKKGSGSFCALYPNSKIQFGWCFTSNVEAEGFFETLTNPTVNKFLKNMISYSIEKGFLKMPVEIAST